MRQEQTKHIDRDVRRLSLSLPLIEEKTGGSWAIGSKQIQNLLTAYWACRTRTTGPDLNLTIELAHDVGPVPCDYVVLMMDIVDECVQYIGDRTLGTPSVAVRLSEEHQNTGLSDFVLEIMHRGSAMPKLFTPSAGLLRVRYRTEEWNGRLQVDQAREDQIKFRATLPFISV